MKQAASLDESLWKTPPAWVREGLPDVPGTPQGFNKVIAKNANTSQIRPNLGRGRGYQYHYSILPSVALAEFVRRHPEVALKGQFNHSSSDIQNDSTSSESEDLWDYFSRKPQEVKDRAEKRLKAIATVEVLVSHGWKKGDAKKEVVNQFKGQLKITFSTLGRWMKQVENIDRSDWITVLVDKHAGRQKQASCSPEAWDYFKADFLRLSAPAAQACYERLGRVAKKKGWNVPSLKTLLRRIDKEISQPAQLLARKGEEALKHSYPAQQRDHSYYHALEAVNADGHKFDVFVRYPDGEIGRPVMVAWQDIFSGKFLGYRVDRTENTDTVRLSFGDLVEKYGLPGHAFLDNGRGFASKWMTGGVPNRYRFKVKEDEPAGILSLMGVQVHWATPYHGQAKPIERAFRDLCEYVAKHPHFEGAYTGNKPDAKPENYGSKAVPFDEFMKVLDQEIIAHNARIGRRSKVCAGRSFDEVFNESYARSTIRKATAEQRRLWLLAAESVSCSRKDGSIALLNNRYYSDVLAQHAGHKMVVRFDPENLHGSVHVYQLDGRYVGEAECHQAAGFGDTQAAREHNRLRNQHKKAAKEQLNRERRMTAMEAAELLPALEPSLPPESKLVQPVFGKSTEVDSERDDERFMAAVAQMQRPRISLLEE